MTSDDVDMVALIPAGAFEHAAQKLLDLYGTCWETIPVVSCPCSSLNSAQKCNKNTQDSKHSSIADSYIATWFILIE